MKLSVLDTRSPDHLPVLVPELERLGFHRYWATEHHSEFQSASPTIVAGLAAGITDHMRVGTAGVLLRAASALRIVEDFATLELFFPGRLDLGVAGALPSGAYATELQRDVPFAPPEAYAERVARLVELVRTRTLAGTSSRIGPRSNSLPELWMCGTSVRAARLAGSLGISFAYHHYLANPDQRINVDVGDAYRGAFVSVEESKPRLLVAAYGHCADSEVRAVEEWKASLALTRLSRVSSARRRVRRQRLRLSPSATAPMSWRSIASHRRSTNAHRRSRVSRRPWMALETTQTSPRQVDGLDIVRHASLCFALLLGCATQRTAPPLSQETVSTDLPNDTSTEPRQDGRL